MTNTLSVLVLAYRHERFVADALASIVAQRDAGAVEVVVGVDHGEDATESIARRWAQESGRAASVLAHPSRVGLLENFRSIFERATGKYIALLEGDDLWLSADKLARQIELLERRPELVLVGHRTEQVTLGGERLPAIPAHDYEEIVPRATFLENDCEFHTSSLVFRNVFDGRLPDGILDPRVGVYDLPLKIALTAAGGVGYVQETMSRFRRVPGSASSAHTDRMWRDAIRRSFSNTRYLLADELRRVADRRIGSLAAHAAIEPGRGGSERIALALRALAHGPGSAVALWSRRAYGRLPNGLQRAYRGARGRSPSEEAP